ncbi:MAG: hypothetical protein M5R42_17330 [Rhodocyclaceae bacterium]|nr:hypothetical protein [Rhodocyclaceae bacterium]
MTTDRPILLVEDNPDDEALTLRAFNKNRIGTPSSSPGRRRSARLPLRQRPPRRPRSLDHARRGTA